MSATDPKSPNSGVRVSDMDQASTSSSLLFDDWSDLLDFNLADTDPFVLPWDDSPSPPPPPPLPSTEPTPPPAPATSTVGKVRKRDPRLVCENFLAGRVPCACPEVDEMMLREEEERETAGGRKRVRVRVREEVVVRCQVKGCEVDIRELKGYHRRHRVCLRCANATSVVIDGEEKRYCQQCGKFHVLPDFDEGKRSCRRKLERHNKRRRRRPTSAVSVVEAEEKGSQEDISEEAIYDGEQKEENGSACETIPSSKVNDGELLLASDGHGSPISSLPTSQNAHSNNIVSFVAAGEARIDEEKDNSKPAFSSTICNNRSAYSSLCPTGRISFKLYDWNPAEFPRRLRHQIFQWLASMPVELEGYVRPGCTILTIFIAMPQFMWEKLSEDATLYVRDLLNAPESLFLGRGNIFIFLSNMIIQVLKDGSSLTNIKMDVKAPRIHYVHPMYFEAGKPIEFVACGSNLNQPKFRFLVSFAGKYMIYDSCAISHGKISSYSCHDSDHEMFRIRISWTDSKIFGPAFVEVENESGISNFIPILIGNKHICMELGRMQVALGGSFAESLASQIATYGVHPNLCELLVAKQTELSDLLVDVAWLLKEACIHENQAIFNPINVQRLICLLDISIQNELFNILKVILKYLEVMSGTVEIQDLECVISGADLKRLQSYVDCAEETLNQRGMHDVTSKVDLRVLKQKDIKPQTYVTSAENQDENAMSKDCMCSFSPTASRERDEDTPLVGPTQLGRKNTCSHLDWPRRPWAHVFPQTIAGTRLTLSVMVSVVMCLGVCIVLLHPRKPSEIVVSIKRCLFGYPIP